MATAKKTRKAQRHLVEELEEQLEDLHKRIGKARANYLSSHEKEFAAARKKMKSLQARLGKAKTRASNAGARFKKTGSKTAGDQLKKARAASLLLRESLGEAKQILLTKQERLNAVKPFDRKLAARAKVLAKFEKDWDKKLKEEAAARSRRAKQAAAKRKAKAKAKS